MFWFSNLAGMIATLCMQYRFSSAIKEIFVFMCKEISKIMTGAITNDVQFNENTNLEFATPEKQEVRAFLRERFLRVITGIVGKQAEFYLYENTRVSAEFRGCDVDCLEVYVRNLETPLGRIPEAILRASDIIHMDVNDINTT